MPKTLLIGSPNSGKSLLFNRLTGLSQKVANYPGVTVEKVTGTFRLGDRKGHIVDIQGAYSSVKLSDTKTVGRGECTVRDGDRCGTAVANPGFPVSSVAVC